MLVFLNGLFTGVLSADGSEFNTLISECLLVFENARLGRFEWVCPELDARYTEAQRRAIYSTKRDTRSLKALLPVCGCSSSSCSSSPSSPSASAEANNAPGIHKQSKPKAKSKKKKSAGKGGGQRRETKKGDHEEKKPEMKPQDEKESNGVENSEEKRRKKERKLDSTEQAAIDASILDSLKSWIKSRPDGEMLHQIASHFMAARHYGTEKGWCYSIQGTLIRGYDVIDSMLRTLGSCVADLKGDKSEITARLLPLFAEAARTTASLMRHMSDILRWVSCMLIDLVCLLYVCVSV